MRCEEIRKQVGGEAHAVRNSGATLAIGQLSKRIRRLATASNRYYSNSGGSPTCFHRGVQPVSTEVSIQTLADMARDPFRVPRETPGRSHPAHTISSVSLVQLCFSIFRDDMRRQDALKMLCHDPAWGADVNYSHEANGLDIPVTIPRKVESMFIHFKERL